MTRQPVEDGEVRAAQGGAQVGAVGADPPPAGDGQVGPGHPFLMAAGQVAGRREAERAQRLGERAGGRVPAGFRDRGDPDRAAGPAQRRVTAVGALADRLKYGSRLSNPHPAAPPAAQAS